MIANACQQIEDRLVDYADGVLPADQAKEVADHLARCPHCREVVQGLQRSLRIAQGIWGKALEEASAIKPDLAPRSKTRCLRVAAIAATIALVAGGIFLAVHRPGQDIGLHSVQQIQQAAERAATAARLLAATELLAQCQDTQALIQAQYRHILADYPDTPAAASLKQRGL